MSYEPVDFDQRCLLLGVETTEGVAETLDPETHAFRLMEGKASTENDKVQFKYDRPYFGGHKSKPTNIRRVIEGNFAVTPPPTPGTNAAPCDLVLQIGGMAVTQDATHLITRYSMISRGIKTATAYWYQGDRFTVSPGCRAAISGGSFKVGDYPKATVKLQGTFASIADDELPTTVDYSAFVDPTVITEENSELYIGDMRAKFGKELTWDLGSDLKTKEYTGARRHRIGSRTPKYKATFAPPPLADFDPYALKEAGTILEFKFLVLEDDGRSTMLVVRGQIEDITENDNEGDFMYELGGECIPSETGSGGDEVRLFFGGPIGLISTYLDPGTVGQPYNEPHPEFKGNWLGEITWSLASGVGPTGATLNPATGLWTGNCSAAGTFNFVIRATSDSGQTATLATSITISA